MCHAKLLVKESDTGDVIAHTFGGGEVDCEVSYIIPDGGSWWLEESEMIDVTEIYLALCLGDVVGTCAGRKCVSG